jgi:S1-C subfamily serine protease
MPLIFGAVNFIAGQATIGIESRPPVDRRQAVMRGPLLWLLVLILAAAGWCYYNDSPGCLNTWNDLVAFGKSVVNGKTDHALGQRTLADAGAVLQVALNRGEKALPITSGGGSLLAGNQDKAVVLIKGDVAQGTGFFVHTPDGPVVITNLHVIAGNPHFRVLTSDGREVQVLSLKGARDRDLAELGIQDDHYQYLDLATDVGSAVQTGDSVITPGDSEGGEVTLDTSGKVLGIGPDRVEISNPIFHGNSGGPVIAQQGGQVVGVVAFGTVVNPTDALDKASLANADSAIASGVRYFSLRIDTVPVWEGYDMDQFTLQSTFLRNFHENSRCLDSILNGLRYEKAGLTSKGAPDSKYYLRNSELRKEVDPNFIVDRDRGVVIEDVRIGILNLQQFAQEGLDSIQNPGNFYSYEWKLAQDEVTYRKALLNELQIMNNKFN